MKSSNAVQIIIINSQRSYDAVSRCGGNKARKMKSTYDDKKNNRQREKKHKRDSNTELLICDPSIRENKTT